MTLGDEVYHGPVKQVTQCDSLGVKGDVGGKRQDGKQ